VEVFHFSRTIRVICPSSSSAAIILLFALSEVTELQIPESLPLDRASAQLANLLGPTQADFEHMASVRTPLFQDIAHQFGPNQPPCLPIADSDPEFEESFVRPTRSIVCESLDPYSGFVRRLAGLWEGSYMVGVCAACLTYIDPTQDFSGRSCVDYRHLPSTWIHLQDAFPVLAKCLSLLFTSNACQY
jgi:hypothetical protein